MNKDVKGLLYLILLRGVSLFFLLSTILKIISFKEIVLLWEDQFGFDYSYISLALIGLIFLELFIFFSLWREKTYAILTGVLVLLMFSGVAIYQQHIGVDNCGCMGTLFSMTPKETLVKNSFLLICLLLAMMLKRRKNEK